MIRENQWSCAWLICRYKSPSTLVAHSTAVLHISWSHSSSRNGQLSFKLGITLLVVEYRIGQKEQGTRLRCWTMRMLFFRNFMLLLYNSRSHSSSFWLWTHLCLFRTWRNIIIIVIVSLWDLREMEQQSALKIYSSCRCSATCAFEMRSITDSGASDYEPSSVHFFLFHFLLYGFVYTDYSPVNTPKAWRRWYGIGSILHVLLFRIFLHLILAGLSKAELLYQICFYWQFWYLSILVYIYRPFRHWKMKLVIF